MEIVELPGYTSDRNYRNISREDMTDYEHKSVNCSVIIKSVGSEEDEEADLQGAMVLK